jgi:hypothetical protein
VGFLAQGDKYRAMKYNPDPPQAPREQKTNGRLTSSQIAFKEVKTMTQKLRENDFDVVGEIIARFRDPRTPSSSKDAMLTLLADRAYPKLRATEVTYMGGEKSPQTIINIISGNVPTTQTIDVTPIDNADR